MIMEIFENVLGSVHDEQVSIVIKISYIPRFKPAVNEGVHGALQVHIYILRTYLSFFSVCAKILMIHVVINL